VLRAAQLVEATRRGSFVEYALASDEVCSVCRDIRALAEQQLADVDRITARLIAGRDEFVSIDRATLRKGVREGSLLLPDVRPEPEYASGHLAGARSIPLDNLSERLSELPRDQTIVAYCRGPYCLFAPDAVRLLREHGFDAIRYDEGVADWKAAGLSVVTGADDAAHTSVAARTRTRSNTKRRNGS
jgi:rhodanese-related sulfurtransferase